jgi:hypothetical protein
LLRFSGEVWQVDLVVEEVGVVGSGKKINGVTRDGGTLGFHSSRGILSLLSRCRMASTPRRRCQVPLPWAFYSRALIWEAHTSRPSLSRGCPRILTKEPYQGGLHLGRGLMQTKSMIRLKLRIWRSSWMKRQSNCAMFHASIALNGGTTTLIASNRSCVSFAIH